MQKFGKTDINPILHGLFGCPLFMWKEETLFIVFLLLTWNKQMFSLSHLHPQLDMYLCKRFNHKSVISKYSVDFEQNLENRLHN